MPIIPFNLQSKLFTTLVVLVVIIFFCEFGSAYQESSEVVVLDYSSKDVYWDTIRNLFLPPRTYDYNICNKGQCGFIFRWDPSRWNSYFLLVKVGCQIIHMSALSEGDKPQILSFTIDNPEPLRATPIIHREPIPPNFFRYAFEDGFLYQAHCRVLFQNTDPLAFKYDDSNLLLDFVIYFEGYDDNDAHNHHTNNVVSGTETLLSKTRQVYVLQPASPILYINNTNNDHQLTDTSSTMSTIFRFNALDERISPVWFDSKSILNLSPYLKPYHFELNIPLKLFPQSLTTNYMNRTVVTNPIMLSYVHFLEEVPLKLQIKIISHGILSQDSRRRCTLNNAHDLSFILPSYWEINKIGLGYNEFSIGLGPLPTLVRFNLISNNLILRCNDLIFWKYSDSDILNNSHSTIEKTNDDNNNNTFIYPLYAQVVWLMGYGATPTRSAALNIPLIDVTHSHQHVPNTQQYDVFANSALSKNQTAPTLEISSPTHNLDNTSTFDTNNTVYNAIHSNGLTSQGNTNYTQLVDLYSISGSFDIQPDVAFAVKHNSISSPTTHIDVPIKTLTTTFDVLLDKFNASKYHQLEFVISGLKFPTALLPQTLSNSSLQPTTNFKNIKLYSLVSIQQICMSTLISVCDDPVSQMYLNHSTYIIDHTAMLSQQEYYHDNNNNATTTNNNNSSNHNNNNNTNEFLTFATSTNYTDFTLTQFNVNGNDGQYPIFVNHSAILNYSAFGMQDNIGYQITYSLNVLYSNDNTTIYDTDDNSNTSMKQELQDLIDNHPLWLDTRWDSVQCQLFLTPIEHDETIGEQHNSNDELLNDNMEYKIKRQSINPTRPSFIAIQDINVLSFYRQWVHVKPNIFNNKNNYMLSQQLKRNQQQQQHHNHHHQKQQLLPPLTTITTSQIQLPMLQSNCLDVIVFPVHHHGSFQFVIENPQHLPITTIEVILHGNYQFKISPIIDPDVALPKNANPPSPTNMEELGDWMWYMTSNTYRRVTYKHGQHYYENDMPFDKDIFNPDDRRYRKRITLKMNNDRIGDERIEFDIFGMLIETIPRPVNCTLLNSNIKSSSPSSSSLCTYHEYDGMDKNNLPPLSMEFVVTYIVAGKFEHEVVSLSVLLSQQDQIQRDTIGNHLELSGELKSSILTTKYTAMGRSIDHQDDGDTVFILLPSVKRYLYHRNMYYSSDEHMWGTWILSTALYYTVFFLLVLAILTCFIFSFLLLGVCLLACAKHCCCPQRTTRWLQKHRSRHQRKSLNPTNIDQAQQQYQQQHQEQNISQQTNPTTTTSSYSLEQDQMAPSNDIPVTGNINVLMRGVRGKKSKVQNQQQKQHIIDRNTNNTSNVLDNQLSSPPPSNPLLESAIATFNRICAFVAPHTDDLDNNTNYTPPRSKIRNDQQNKSNTRNVVIDGDDENPFDALQ